MSSDPSDTPIPPAASPAAGDPSPAPAVEATAAVAAVSGPTDGLPPAPPPAIEPVATPAASASGESTTGAGPSAAPTAPGGGPGKPRGKGPMPDVGATAALLKHHFPGLFGGTPKPIKLQIHADIQQRKPNLFTRAQLSAFLHRHTTSTPYLVALAEATQRFDLDGNPAGELAAEHREAAAQELTRRRQLRRERQAPPAPDPAELQARRDRARLLRDFETTTLTRANFCALKGIASDALDSVLQQARQEQAEWAARSSHGGPAAGPHGGPRADRGPMDRRHDARDARGDGRAPDRPRGDRPDRPDRSDRPDRPERWDRGTQADRPARAEHPGRADPASRQERGDRGDRPPRADRPPRDAAGQGAAATDRSRPARPPRQGAPGEAAAGAPAARREPGPPRPPTVVVRADALCQFVRLLVQRGGSSEREARLVADNLVEANLTGHDSHGVGMIPAYVDNLLAGGLKANQSLKLLADHGSMLTLDGQAGYGQVMGHDAMALGIERAKAHGVAVLGLANSHHIGRIGAWAEQCLAAGLVSVHFVNVISKPIVAPFNGTDGRFVTNPFCVGIPVAGAEPIVLDFATSRIAMGKVRVAHHKGQTVKPGTLLDAQGHPSIDPGVMFGDPGGALLPFGEHKGYGLAVVCEILGGALAGGITLHDKPNPNAIINNMLSFIVDPDRLGTAQRLTDEARAFATWVQQSPPMPGQRVQLPGDPERARRRRRLAEGIPIDGTSFGLLLEAGRKLGLSDAEMRAAAGLPAEAPAAVAAAAAKSADDAPQDPATSASAPEASAATAAPAAAPAAPEAPAAPAGPAAQGSADAPEAGSDAGPAASGTSPTM